MKKKPELCFILLFALIAYASSQDGTGFALGAEPTIVIPLPGSHSESRFSLGMGASISADYVPPALPYLVLGGGLDYTTSPEQLGSSLQTLGASAGAGVRLRLLPSLSAIAWGRGGYGLGIFADTQAPTPYLKAGLDLGLYLTPSFRIALGGAYSHYFASSEALFQGIGASLSIGYNFNQSNRKSKLEIRDIIIDPIYPVFYKFYDSNKIGSLVIRNGENAPIKDVRISFFVKQYMDAPKDCAVIPIMKQGEERSVPLTALFTRAILEVLEQTKAQAEILVTYSYVDDSREAKAATAATINHRNGLTWDDDRKVASFVTMNDPAVMSFAKQVAGIARASGYQTMDEKFRQAAGVFESISLYGVQYVESPNLPYSEVSKSKTVVDYVQFPAQTLQFRAGDCKNLAVLENAMLEAIGVETGFITVPGHIFAVFALDMSPEFAKTFFYRQEDLIVRDGKVWIPVESTAVGEGFVKAWQLGAKEWRESSAKGEAAFLSTHEAWKLYEPEFIPSSGARIEPPSDDKVLAHYQAAMKTFIDRELNPRLEKTNAEIAAAKSDPHPVNKRGILYASYDQYDKAETDFRASIKLGDSMQAEYNLGNILMLKKAYKEALAAYQSSYRVGQGNLRAIAGMILASYELDDRASASRWLDELKSKDPSTAAKYAYVSGGDGNSGVRASSVSTESLPWEE